MENAKRVSLEAHLLYIGSHQDSRTVTIELGEEPHASPVSIELSGVPNFVTPGDTVEIAALVNNVHQENHECNIIIVLESVIGIETILGRVINLEHNETKLVPISVQIPLGAEMSTAYLKAIVEGENYTSETRERIKIKAIEEPLFEVIYSIKDESGKVVPGLIPRLTPVKIEVQIAVLKEGIQNLDVQLKIMSRRRLVEQFDLPALNQEKSKYQAHIYWHTPSVEMVTGFYLEIVALQAGRQLPSRAIRQTPKQLTVY
jgi:hypothetical protein